MHKLLLLLIIFIVSTAQAQTLKLASDVWPPFTNVENEVHFSSDIVLEALKRSGYSAEISIIDFGDVIAQINQSKYDGSAALWISDERQETMLFSRPYLENRLVLVGKKGSPVIYTELSELRGKKLAIVPTYDYGPELRNQKSLILAEAKNEQECLNLLLAGQVDYILLDNLLAHHLKEYQHTDVSNFLAIGNVPMLNKSLHFAVSKNVPNAEEIINQFNASIEEMIKDGSYNDLLNISWILADVDNDGRQELVLRGDKAGTVPPEHIYQIIQSTDKAMADETPNRYLVQGEIYDSWNDIPEEYKSQSYNMSNNIRILSLNINKK